MHRSSCFALVAAAACAAPACAQVYGLSLTYSGYAWQTDDTPPVSASPYYFVSRLHCASEEDFGVGRLTYPDGAEPVEFSLDEPLTWTYYPQDFPSQEAMLAAYPMGEYWFEFDGGTYGYFQHIIDRQVDLFPPSLAAFTNGTVPAMQGVDTQQDFTIHVAPFEIQPGGNTAYTYVWVFTLPNFDQVFSDGGFQPWTSTVIPAGTLPPDQQLIFYTLNTSRLEYFDPSYGGWTSISFDYWTLADGYTLPDGSLCPADFNQDGGIDGADVDAFFIAWENGDASSDVNQDGGIDGADVDTFFAAWENGGCG